MKPTLGAVLGWLVRLVALSLGRTLRRLLGWDENHLITGGLAALIGVYAIGVMAVPLMENSRAREDWLAWAEQRGSPELRRMIPDVRLEDAPDMELARERFAELLRADVASALTPAVDGAARCQYSIQLGAPVDVPSPAERQVLARIREAVPSSSLPRRAQIAVGPLRDCVSNASRVRAVCVPIDLRHDEFAVSSSYCLSPQALN